MGVSSGARGWCCATAISRTIPLGVASLSYRSPDWSWRRCLMPDRRSRSGTPEFACEAVMNQDTSPAVTSTRHVCPTCGELLDADGARFCQACGADVSASSTEEVPEATQAEEKARPWFRLVVLVWLLI